MYVCMCIIYMQCPQGSEEGARYSRAGVRDSCDSAWVLGTELRSTAGAGNALTSELLFHHLLWAFLIHFDRHHTLLSSLNNYSLKFCLNKCGKNLSAWIVSVCFYEKQILVYLSHVKIQNTHPNRKHLLPKSLCFCFVFYFSRQSFSA